MAWVNTGSKGLGCAKHKAHTGYTRKYIVRPVQIHWIFTSLPLSTLPNTCPPPKELIPRSYLLEATQNLSLIHI